MNNYTIIWKEDTFTIYFSGEINLKDLMAANDEIAASSKLCAITHYYVDFCNVDCLNVSDREMKMYATYDAVMPRFIKQPLVCVAYRVPTSAMKQQLKVFLKNGHTEWPRQVFISGIIAETWVQDGCSLHDLFLKAKQTVCSAIA